MLKTLLLLSVPCLAQTPAGGPAVAVSTPPATVENLYRPVNPRDPMAPSTFFGDHKPRFSSSDPAPAAFSTSTLSGLSLTGVLEDASGRQAMLTDRASGAVYILKGGILLDSRRKAVPEVKGAIKGKRVELTRGAEKLVLDLHGKLP